MKTLNSPFVVLLTCSLICNLACRSNPKKNPAKIGEIDLGSTFGNVYTNNSLGVRMKFPEGMTIDSVAELDAAQREGQALLKKGDRNHDEMLDAIGRQERIIFGLNSSETESPAYLSITAKRGIGDNELKDATAGTLELLVRSSKVKVVQPVTEEVIAGVHFTTFATLVEDAGSSVYSKVYGFRRNDHTVTVSISYAEERGLKQMENVLRGIEFF